MADNDNIHATLRAEVEQFRRMIRQSSLSGETEHSDIYLNIREDEVQVLQAAPGEVVLTYCTFGPDWFDEISVERESREMEGEDSDGNEFHYPVGAEAILNVESILTSLDIASEGGIIEMNFTGSEDRRLATFMRANGALNAWVKLPGSQATLEDIPHWLPFRFNVDDYYTNQNGDPTPTTIQTNVSKIETIIRAVDDTDNADFYPVVVQDGDFRLNVGEEQQSGYEGTLNAQSVEGPDVENFYHDGFVEIFEVLSGKVELQTAPGNNPMSIVQRGDSGRTIRHINGPVDN